MVITYVCYHNHDNSVVYTFNTIIFVTCISDLFTLLYEVVFYFQRNGMWQIYCNTLGKYTPIALILHGKYLFYLMNITLGTN